MANAEVALHRAAFKEALGRIVNDEEFGKRLEEKPGTALRSLGLEFPDNVATELDSRPLSQTIEQAFGPATEGPRPEILPIVVVFVAVEVAVRVATRVKPMLSLDEAITNAAGSNIALKD